MCTCKYKIPCYMYIQHRPICSIHSIVGWTHVCWGGLGNEGTTLTLKPRAFQGRRSALIQTEVTVSLATRDWTEVKLEEGKRSSLHWVCWYRAATLQVGLSSPPEFLQRAARVEVARAVDFDFVAYLHVFRSCVCERANFGPCSRLG